MYFLGPYKPLTIIVMAGMMLIAFLGGALLMNSLPDVVSEEYSSAKVISIENKTMKSRTRTGIDTTTQIAVAQLELKDGKKFRTTLFKPYPLLGETVSVKVLHYSDGTRSAAVVN